MKTKQDRWATRWCKKLNRQLSEDVFKDRFSIREVQKMGYINDHSEHWYIFELRDKKDPSRNYQFRVLSHTDRGIMCDIYNEMNEFIATSGFWKEYRKDRENGHNN